jgi:hypothetical protein
MQTHPNVVTHRGAPDGGMNEITDRNLTHCHLRCTHSDDCDRDADGHTRDDTSIPHQRHHIVQADGCMPASCNEHTASATTAYTARALGSATDNENDSFSSPSGVPHRSNGNHCCAPGRRRPASRPRPPSRSLRGTRALRLCACRIHHIGARRLGRVTHRAVVRRGVGVRARRGVGVVVRARRGVGVHACVGVGARRPRRAWASASASVASPRATADSYARRRRRLQLRRAHCRLHPCERTRPNGLAPRRERKPLGTITA